MPENQVLWKTFYRIHVIIFSAILETNVCFLTIKFMELGPGANIIKKVESKSRFPPKLNFAKNNLLGAMICKFIDQITIILAKSDFETFFIS